MKTISWRNTPAGMATLLLGGWLLATPVQALQVISFSPQG